MSIPIVFLLVIVPIIGTSAADIDPYDLLSEARDQLRQLRIFTIVSINSAHRDLDILAISTSTYRENEFRKATIQIHQEYETFDDDVIVLQNLAQSAGKDISSCLIEDDLLSLTNAAINNLSECLVWSDQELKGIIGDATYRIDVLINRIDVLEFQLNYYCADASILCIAPIVNDIELENINIPTTIRGELNTADVFLAELRQSINSCSHTRVADFIAHGNLALTRISNCVNNILS